MNLKDAINLYVKRAQDAAKTAGEEIPTVPYLLETVDLAQMPKGTTRRHVLRKAMNMGLLAKDACSKWEQSIDASGQIIPEGRRGGASLHVDAVLEATPEAKAAAELLAAKAAVDAQPAPRDEFTLDASGLQVGEPEVPEAAEPTEAAPRPRRRGGMGLMLSLLMMSANLAAPVPEFPTNPRRS